MTTQRNTFFLNWKHFRQKEQQHINPWKLSQLFLGYFTLALGGVGDDVKFWQVWLSQRTNCEEQNSFSLVFGKTLLLISKHKRLVGPPHSSLNSGTNWPLHTYIFWNQWKSLGSGTWFSANRPSMSFRAPKSVEHDTYRCDASTEAVCSSQQLRRLRRINTQGMNTKWKSQSCQSGRWLDLHADT